MTREKFIKQFPVGSKVRLKHWGKMEFFKVLYYGDKAFFFVDDEGNEVARYSLNWEAVKEKGHLIKTITSTSKGHPKIELHDGQTALIHLGKHHRLFVDRVDVTSDGKSIQTVGFDANKI